MGGLRGDAELPLCSHQTLPRDCSLSAVILPVTTPTSSAKLKSQWQVPRRACVRYDMLDEGMPDPASCCGWLSGYSPTVPKSNCTELA